MPAQNENQVSCSNCDAVYDVTGIEPGSTFECEECGKTILIPTHDKKSQTTGMKKPAVASRSRQTATPPRETRGRSPAVLLAVVGVALVLVVVILLLRDSSTPTGNAPSGGSRTRTADNSSGETTSEPVSPSERRKEYTELRKAAKASGSARDWFKLACWCEETGYQTEEKRAEKLFKYIIRKIDSDHPGTRKKLGYTLYDGEIEKFKKLKWLDPEELKTVREIEKRKKIHEEMLGADPWYQASEKLIEELKNDKHLKKFNLEFTRYKPFVIAKQRKNPSTDAFKHRVLGEMLQAAAADFVKAFAKDLGLKPLDQVKFKGKASVLPIIYFENKFSFDNYHMEMGQKIPEGAAAYFMPSNNRIVYYEGEGKGSEQFNLNKLVHELTHQLVWFYTPSRTRCQLHFFQEGIAEFFSGTSRKPYTNEQGKRSYHYTFRGKLRGRMKHLKFADINHWFDFAELMQVHNKMAMHRLSKKKAGDDRKKQLSCQSLFYAEAWSLFYFLWHHKDGVYRKNLIKYTGLELEGKTGLRHFRAAFEGVNLREVGRKWRIFINSSGKFLSDS